MSNLRTLRRRIRSIKNIHDITKAMEMISAVRFRRVDSRYRKSLPFIENLESLMARMLTRELVAQHPLFEQRKLERELLVVVTGDRGLCGSFNTNVLKSLTGYMREQAGRDIKLLSIGKVGSSFIRRRGWQLTDAISNQGHKFMRQDAERLTKNLVNSFKSGATDKVTILAMKMERQGVHRPVFESFLDMNYLFEKKQKDEREVEYIFEPDQASTFESLLNLFVRQKLFIVILRAITAEFNARMVAMKMATDNSKELIGDLTLERNKLRQAMITKEISEIIGGVNAMN